MLRQPIRLITIELGYKPRSVFPCAWLGTAVNEAAACVRIATIPLLDLGPRFPPFCVRQRLLISLMVMFLLTPPFGWSSNPTAVHRVLFTSLDQVTRVAIATGGKVQLQALGRLQNPDRLYYDLIGINLQAHENRTETILVGNQLL